MIEVIRHPDFEQEEIQNLLNTCTKFERLPDWYLTKETTLINDICILKIDKKVKFDDNVQRPCFSDMKPEVGEECFVAGYGTKAYNDETVQMTTVGVFIGTVELIFDYYEFRTVLLTKVSRRGYMLQPISCDGHTTTKLLPRAARSNGHFSWFYRASRRAAICDIKFDQSNLCRIFRRGKRQLSRWFRRSTDLF